MGFIDNITISITDLAGIKPDIARFGEVSDTFATEIENAKKTVYRQIREDYSGDYPDHSDAELDADLAHIKDTTGGYLKDKIVYQCLADIMLANEMPDLQKTYQDRARAINAMSYVDLDSDSVVDSTEKRNPPENTFTR